MLQKNDYVFTPEMRDDLRRYLNGEPTFGHYQPTLFYSTQATDADQDQQPQPDPHYYQAAGEEPPQQARRGLSIRTVCCWVMFWVAVGEIVLLFWPGLGA